MRENETAVGAADDYHTYMAGARLEAQYPVSAIFHNLALNTTVLSNLNHMDWGIVCAEGEDAWSQLEAVYAEHRRLHD